MVSMAKARAVISVLVLLAAAAGLVALVVMSLVNRGGKRKRAATTRPRVAHDSSDSDTDSDDDEPTPTPTAPPTTTAPRSSASRTAASIVDTLRRRIAVARPMNFASVFDSGLPTATARDTTMPASAPAEPSAYMPSGAGSLLSTLM